MEIARPAVLHPLGPGHRILVDVEIAATLHWALVERMGDDDMMFLVPG